MGWSANGGCGQFGYTAEQFTLTDADKAVPQRVGEHVNEPHVSKEDVGEIGYRHPLGGDSVIPEDEHDRDDQPDNNDGEVALPGDAALDRRIQRAEAKAVRQAIRATPNKRLAAKREEKGIGDNEWMDARAA